MFKKIVEFFTGKKPESNYAHPLDAVTKSNPGHPGWPMPVPQAPYKVPEPAATTPIPLIVTNSNPADNVPVVDQLAVVNAAEGSAVPAAPEKKKRTFTKKPAAPKAAPKAAAIKAPAKPRAKKTPQ